MADIIIMNAKTEKKKVENVINKIKQMGFDVNISKGAEKIVIGIIGDTRGISDETFKLMPGVIEVINLQVVNFILKTQL